MVCKLTNNAGETGGWYMYLFLSVDNNDISEGSSAISIDSSYSECVAAVWSESTGSEVSGCYHASGCGCEGSISFLELYAI